MTSANDAADPFRRRWFLQGRELYFPTMCRNRSFLSISCASKQASTLIWTASICRTKLSLLLVIPVALVTNYIPFAALSIYFVFFLSKSRARSVKWVVFSISNRLAPEILSLIGTRLQTSYFCF